jgi:hypothetical protein
VVVLDEVRAPGEFNIVVSQPFLNRFPSTGDRLKAASEGFLLVQTAGQDSFPSFHNLVFSVIKNMFQPIYRSFWARFPSIIRKNEGLKCPPSMHEALNGQHSCSSTFK